MKRLSKLLKGIKGVYRIQGEMDIDITHLTADSREVRPGSLFVAWKGRTNDGHRFAHEAVARGARAILVETPIEIDSSVTLLQTQNSREAYAHLCAAWFEYPAYHLKTIGITGTNGKSSTAYYIYQLLKGLGRRVGLIGTVFCLAEEEILPATLTTPDSYELHRLLSYYLQKGISHVVMEVSSIALDQRRTEGIPFSGAIFTNLSHDHLDYHGSFAAYRDAKKRLFDNLSQTAFALTNADDKHGLFMLQNTSAVRYSYSLQGVADFSLRLRDLGLWGIEYELHLRYGEAHPHREIPLLLETSPTLTAPLIGRFQGYNLLAAVAGAFLIEGEGEIAELRARWHELVQLSTLLRTLPGRLEPVPLQEGRVGLVDYAHSPDAVEQVLQTLRPLLSGEGKLVVVLGAGGDRDRKKRAPMGQIAARLADIVILTSDNPRSEDPLSIIQEMMEGIPLTLRSKVFAIPDRQEAIQTAVQLSPPRSLIAVLGKGHETYQEIQGIKYPFSDRAVLEALAYAH
ncbi:MAG: UDP-N-acetylmuramoyl-L-alanyl-D-glutamate--2,6-diaminopimelate ligase [Bacteroidia bacterium]|nr:UDP-N-acetylmuramoyl-L-alanyl-D-glutamate--2,6-diaminopimelate ligase [Bacteroidia bacterium]MDW8015788.1 UDP-N-acetylmuramoyl-L-alanyl-D-glutamate--2,6-diaminopimelate ligase [Bacteroidia bacterium]